MSSSPARPATPLPPLLLARHAETVYNAGGRMQGASRHTPLTHAGIAQAHAMGEALRAALGARPALTLWASPAGRTLQTAAIIAEHLGLDFFAIREEPRLLEIDVGGWEGRAYADIVAESGSIVDLERRLFSQRPPGGEWYPEVAARLGDWVADLATASGPQLAISHGITARVLRGLLVGGTPYGPEATPIADDVPQGTVMRIEAGREAPVHVGTGSAGEHRLKSV